jgi:hypothetical protein
VLARVPLALRAVRPAALVPAAGAADLHIVTVAHLDRATFLGRPRLDRGVAGREAPRADRQGHHLPNDLGPHRCHHPPKLAQAPTFGQLLPGGSAIERHGASR